MVDECKGRVVLMEEGRDADIRRAGEAMQEAQREYLALKHGSRSQHPEMLSDEEILSNGGIVIMIAGSRYLWCSPVRRRARAMLAALGPILRCLPRSALEKPGELASEAGVQEAVDSDVGEGPEGDVGLSRLMEQLEAVNLMLDWLCAWHPEMERDRIKLDEADELEITTAFGAVLKMVTAPFVSGGRSGQDVKAGTEGSLQTHTLKADVMNL